MERLFYIITVLLLCLTGNTAFGQSANKATFTVDVKPKSNGWEVPDQQFEVIVIPKYEQSGFDAEYTPKGSNVSVTPVIDGSSPNYVKQIRYNGQVINVPDGFKNRRMTNGAFSSSIRSMDIVVIINGESYHQTIEIHGKNSFHIPLNINPGEKPNILIDLLVKSATFDDARVKQFVDEIYGFNTEKTEKEKSEQKKTEQEKQEATAKEKAAASGSAASSGGSDKKEEKSDDKEEKGSDKKGSEAVYIPKSNRQLYNELKAMTDAHPEMLNDPKIRTRLRGYKAFADRDDRNIRDYNTLEQTMGGGYNPNKITAMNSIYQTNSNIAQAEMGVGAVVDEATNVVNSIIEASNRKTEEGWVAEDNKKDAAMAKKKAIGVWQNQLRENRFAYERATKKKIEENFKLVTTISDLPITYETEEYKEGKPYWKGRVEITPSEFVKTTKTMDRTYNLYIAELDGLYGILGDGGEALYPPQFEGIYSFREVDKRPRFLVNIKDKWGEILADGSITEEIKYDGIWYTTDKKDKVLKYGDNWQLKSLEGNRLLKQFTTTQLPDLYAGGLIPVSNSNIKGFNQTNGSYSLASDGKIYVWGKSTEKGVSSISYEMAKKGEVTERLFKMNGKWFITSGFGTKDMKIEPMPSTFVIPVIREKKWGAVNQAGKTVIPFENSYIRISGNQLKTDNGVYKVDGTLASTDETEIKNGEREYFDNGNLKSIGAYGANGRATGMWKYYHENGGLKSMGSYQNGNRNGIWKFYEENGNLERDANYKNGEMDGICRFYYDDGKTIKFVSTFPEGSVTFYYQSGAIEGKGQQNRNGVNGNFIYYYENGSVKSEGLYENGKESGVWKYYYENGKLKETGIYKNGEKTGKWEQYDKNGNKI